MNNYKDTGRVYTLQDLFDLGLKLEVGDVFAGLISGSAVQVKDNRHACDCNEQCSSDSLRTLISSRQLDEHLNKELLEQLSEIMDKSAIKSAEWDGEYLLEDDDEWFKYKTTYKASNGDMFAMCLVPHANSGKPFEQYLDAGTTSFREIETPEQKAEREREKAVYSMCAEVDNFTDDAMFWAGRFYDLGYHKQ